MPGSSLLPGETYLMSAFRNKKGVSQGPDDKSPSSAARNELAYTPKGRVTDIGGNVKKNPSGSAKALNTQGDSILNPDRLSTISVADLPGLVKKKQKDRFRRKRMVW